MGFFPQDTPGFGTLNDSNTAPSERCTSCEMGSAAREHQEEFNWMLGLEHFSMANPKSGICCLTAWGWAPSHLSRSEIKHCYFVGAAKLFSRSCIPLSFILYQALMLYPSPPLISLALLCSNQDPSFMVPILPVAPFTTLCSCLSSLSHHGSSTPKLGQPWVLRALGNQIDPTTLCTPFPASFHDLCCSIVKSVIVGN